LVASTLTSHSTKGEVIKSLFFRFAGMGLGFIATAILIRELGAASYGAWAALTSLLAWIQLSDFGVGYALKNRIAGAQKPNELLPLVGGVFQFYVLIAILVCISFLLFGSFLTIVSDYKTESLVLYLGTIIFFPLTIGAAVLQGMRKNSISTLMGFAQSFFWLMCVIILAWVNTTLLFLSLLYILIVLLIGMGQFVASIRVLVGGARKSFIELRNFGNLRLAFPLWGIGIRFILLQLSSVVLFSLGTYLTYSNLTPEDAAKYDVLFKFFQVPLTFFNVIISVYWVEIARAIAKHDRNSMQQKFIQLQAVALGISLLMLIFALLIASPLVDVYSGGKIIATTSEILAFWLLIVIQLFAYSGAVFLNAAEKLRGQIIIAVAGAILLIPTVLFLYAQEVGFSAVPLATSLIILPSLIYCNWAAYYHVIKKIS
jgi:O-antigen/teichoic acid export membrane protein